MNADRNSGIGSPEPAVVEHRRESYLVSTDRGKLDLDVIHTFLTSCYWCPGIPREVVARSIQGSLCFGVYEGERQVGFARVITDYATYGYIADIFILESHRGRGLSKWMMECIMGHPALQGLRRWSLVTRDAHGLYQPFGFVRPADPDRYMEIIKRDIYRKTGQ